MNIFGEINIKQVPGCGLSHSTLKIVAIIGIINFVSFGSNATCQDGTRNLKAGEEKVFWGRNLSIKC